MEGKVKEMEAEAAIRERISKRNQEAPPEFLPIGSVVIVKGSVKKVVVIARGMLSQVEDRKKYFDYGACLYPEGIISDSILYFQKEDVEEVIYRGYEDEDEVRMGRNLIEGVKRLKEKEGEGAEK